MKEYEIGKNEAGQRLDKYLRKLFPLAPGSFLYKMLRKKNIVWNGKKADGAQFLSVGDRIACWLSDETIAKFQCPRDDIRQTENLIQKQTENPIQKLDILYEDSDILAINKPAGMLSQKSRPDDFSANEAILNYLLEKGELTKEELFTFRPSICNRIDRNTSGILTAGKTLHGLQDLTAQFRERSAQKYYLCIAIGELKEPVRLSGHLEKDAFKNRAYLNKRAYLDKKASFVIETEYEPLQTYDGFTLLEAHLITGRTHQIRAQLSSIGHALAGDPKYGDPNINAYFKKKMHISRQMLHAHRLVLKNGLEITAPPPEDFTRALDLLRL